MSSTSIFPPEAFITPKRDPFQAFNNQRIRVVVRNLPQILAEWMTRLTDEEMEQEYLGSRPLAESKEITDGATQGRFVREFYEDVCSLFAQNMSEEIDDNLFHEEPPFSISLVYIYPLDRNMGDKFIPGRDGIAMEDWMYTVEPFVRKIEPKIVSWFIGDRHEDLLVRLQL